MGRIRLARRHDAKGRNAGKYAALRTVATLLVGAGGTHFIGAITTPAAPAFWGGLAAMGVGVVLFFVDVALQIID